MQGQSDEFKTRAAERLFVAVLNQAILDMLERASDGEPKRVN